MRIGFAVNRIETEATDYTTTHLAMAATNRGHEVWYIGMGDFAYDPDERVHAWALSVPRTRYRSVAVYLKELQGGEAIRQRINVADLEVLLLRNDPAEDVTERPWAR